MGITETDAYSVQFERLGYEQRNVIVNMGCIIVVIGFILLKVLLALIFSICGCMS